MSTASLRLCFLDRKRLLANELLDPDACAEGLAAEGSTWS